MGFDFPTLKLKTALTTTQSVPEADSFKNENKETESQTWPKVLT